MARLVFTPFTDVVVSNQTITQFRPVAIDLSAHTSPGDRLYSIDMPEGLEIMADAHKILGAATTAQSQTTHNIFCQAASGPNFWIRLDLTVAAPAGTVYTEITTAAGLFALTEFGGAYTGPGCVVELGAGVTIDMTGQTFNDRLRNLSSQIVIRSADTGNRAKFTGAVTFATGTLQPTGDISFVDIDFERNQTGASITPGEALPAANIVSMAGQSTLRNVGFIRCGFSSDVGDGKNRVQPKQEIGGVVFNRPADTCAVWGCTFTNLFNGVSSGGSNILIAKNTMTESWGDMVRATSTPGPSQAFASHILVCDNTIFGTPCDGLIRHPDGVQIFGTGTSSEIRDFERRGDISFNDGATFPQLPAINPSFWNANLVDTTTNETASTTDLVLYRMRTDTAGSNLTVTLPDITAVSTNWQLCVQKYSGDGTYSAIVDRNGATINGASENYSILGKWKAVRFFKASSTNWGVEVQGTGIQHGIYQDDSRMDALDRALVWNCVTSSGARAGHSFEALAKSSKVESCTVVRLLPTDFDGDGIIDANEGKTITEEWPNIEMRNTSADGSLTVTKCIAPTILRVVGSSGTFTESDNDVSQTTTDSTTTALFIGEGLDATSRGEQVWSAQHKTTGAAAGTGRGAISYGPATLRYDFLNKRVRIPGAPECTAPPVIELSGSTYQIATDATFDTAGTKSYQWCVDHEPIAGQTGTTLTQANAPAGRITLRVTLPSATLGDCIAESNGLVEA